MTFCNSYTVPHFFWTKIPVYLFGAKTFVVMDVYWRSEKWTQCGSDEAIVEICFQSFTCNIYSTSILYVIIVEYDLVVHLTTTTTNPWKLGVGLFDPTPLSVSIMVSSFSKNSSCNRGKVQPGCYIQPVKVFNPPSRTRRNHIKLFDPSALL